MVAITGLFSGIAVKDIDKARSFYSDTLGLSVKDDAMNALNIALPQGGIIYIYPKDDHTPATYTVLNLEVSDIDAAVDELKSKGVTFEVYEGAHQDDKAIARGKAAGFGPDIAWFLDPSGNILSVLSN
ncbi:MAG TPA: VOC family protein [Galbitalea sp.]|jgi:catechol 2,3-dioxygenase-like lactoylglutathione lyase family enzyme|nr:VOC family protein [Galbitalea sp.]